MHDQCVQEVLAVTQATVSKFDQCQFGSLDTGNIGSTKHYGKRSKLITTIPAIDAIIGGKLCQEEHEHIRSSGGEAQDALIHPPQLCTAILSAIELQRKWTHVDSNCLATIEAEGKIPAGSDDIPEEESTNEILEAWDDATGEDFDPVTVPGGQKRRNRILQSNGAFTKVRYHNVLPEPEASQSGVRWRDINREIGSTSMSQQTDGTGIQQ